MIRDEALEENMNLYLLKMQQKLQQDSLQIKNMEQRLHGSAKKIQRLFRKFINKKKFLSALKVQRWWKAVSNRNKSTKKAIKSFNQLFYGLKIFYFLKKTIIKPQIQTELDSSLTKITGVNKSIKSNCLRYMKIQSSIKAEIDYIKRYEIFEKKSFFEKWKNYEKLISEKLWSSVKKKWVRKNKTIWINQKDKEVKAEQYINGLIESIYNKKFEEFEKSQKRLKAIYSVELKGVFESTRQAYYARLLQQ